MCRRTDLGIVREVDPQKKLTVRTIRCPIMLVTGDYSPHLDDTVAMNARLDPAVCSWMKVGDGVLSLIMCYKWMECSAVLYSAHLSVIVH